MLFAVSMSQVYPVTLGEDYCRDESSIPAIRHGFSKFYSGDKNAAIALRSPCDAHFIPVKQYGRMHPVTGVDVGNILDYQAAPAAEAEFHELVIASHHRCLPIAVIYFKPK